MYISHRAYNKEEENRKLNILRLTIIQYPFSMDGCIHIYAYINEVIYHIIL